jgi:hypothetical protein
MSSGRVSCLLLIALLELPPAVVVPEHHTAGSTAHNVPLVLRQYLRPAHTSSSGSISVTKQTSAIWQRKWICEVIDLLHLSPLLPRPPPLTSALSLSLWHQ